MEKLNESFAHAKKKLFWAKKYQNMGYAVTYEFKIPNGKGYIDLFCVKGSHKVAVEAEVYSPMAQATINIKKCVNFGVDCLIVDTSSIGKAMQLKKLIDDVPKFTEKVKIYLDSRPLIGILEGSSSSCRSFLDVFDMNSIQSETLSSLVILINNFVKFNGKTSLANIISEIDARILDVSNNNCSEHPSIRSTYSKILHAIRILQRVLKVSLYTKKLNSNSAHDKIYIPLTKEKWEKNFFTPYYNQIVDYQTYEAFFFCKSNHKYKTNGRDYNFLKPRYLLLNHEIATYILSHPEKEIDIDYLLNRFKVNLGDLVYTINTLWTCYPILVRNKKILYTPSKKNNLISRDLEEKKSPIHYIKKSIYPYTYLVEQTSVRHGKKVKSIFKENIGRLFELESKNNLIPGAEIKANNLKLSGKKKWIFIKLFAMGFEWKDGFMIKDYIEKKGKNQKIYQLIYDFQKMKAYRPLKSNQSERIRKRIDYQINEGKGKKYNIEKDKVKKIVITSGGGEYIY